MPSYRLFQPPSRLHRRPRVFFLCVLDFPSSLCYFILFWRYISSKDPLEGSVSVLAQSGGTGRIESGALSSSQSPDPGHLPPPASTSEALSTRGQPGGVSWSAGWGSPSSSTTGAPLFSRAAGERLPTWKWKTPFRPVPGLEGVFGQPSPSSTFYGQGGSYGYPPPPPSMVAAQPSAARGIQLCLGPSFPSSRDGSWGHPVRLSGTTGRGGPSTFFRPLGPLGRLALSSGVPQGHGPFTGSRSPFHGLPLPSIRRLRP